MSIYDNLNPTQVNAFIDLIRNECNRVAWNEAELARPIDPELYDRIKKGRKAHNLTFEIYVKAFYPDNQIDGIDVHDVMNGIYTQPEFIIGNTVIHIYHASNKLDSALIESLKNNRDIQFFCIMFQPDEDYHLQYIDAIHLRGNEKYPERIYTTPNITIQAG